MRKDVLMVEKYTILEGDSMAELILEVNKYLSKGWSLQGGVCRDRYWYQALKIRQLN